jgi:hypothetical protein
LTQDDDDADLVHFDDDGETSTLPPSPETTFRPVLEPVQDAVLDTTLPPNLSPAEYIANVDDVFEFHVR